MRQKDREARRQRIAALEQREALARCAWCKAPLPKGWPVRFCSAECEADHAESLVKKGSR